MTSINEIAWDDTILPFQLETANIRGRVARLDKTLEMILSQHNYPTPVAALVAEAALLTALIGQTIKLRWKLSLQIRGDGPIRLIATDYFAPKKPGDPAEIRAYASYDADALPTAGGTPFQKLGKGMFALLMDQGDGTTPYQGITPLAGSALADCAETYFAQSEQLPTRFALGIAEATAPGDEGKWRAGGVMLQHVATSELTAREAAGGPEGLLTSADILQGEDAEDWNRVTMHLQTVELTELIGPHVNPDTLLVRLFHEEVPRVFDPQSIRFGCTCGPDKVVQSMSIYSAKDIGHMTNDEGKVTADCQFCGAHYEFDPAKLGFEAES